MARTAAAATLVRASWRERLRDAWAARREAAPRRACRCATACALRAPSLQAFDRSAGAGGAGAGGVRLVMVYSASIALPDSRKFAAYTPTYFLVRHAFFALIGVIVAFAVVQVPVAFWEKPRR
jgi:hypothetical protein